MLSQHILVIKVENNQVFPDHLLTRSRQSSKPDKFGRRLQQALHRLFSARRGLIPPRGDTRNALDTSTPYS